MTDEVFEGLVDQEEAVARLRAAARSPVHAYLFVGPRGVGKSVAARGFAALLLSGDDSVDEDAAARHRRLALDGAHPDLVEIRPAGRTLRVEEAERLVVEASRSPIEGRRKVVVAERFHTAEPTAAASLLKTIEEPPASTVFVLLAEDVPDEHVTIASRCVRIDLPPARESALVEHLVAGGVDADRAAVIARAARGSVERAQQLVDDDRFLGRHEAWRSVPDRLDGSGAVVAALTNELRELIDDAQGPLEVRHRQQLEELAEQEETFGLRGSGRRELVEQQKREVRLLRDDELRFGLATLATCYREAAVVDPSGPGAAATDRLRNAADALIRNPNEALWLQALLLDLPSS